MFQMHRDYQSKDNATFEQRAVALVLDLTIIGILKGLLPLPLLFGSFLPILYFVILQCQFGFTPGKYFAGLRVISTTGKTSIPKMFLRESIGKLISSLIFLLGYLVVMLSKKRLAWHDKMSSTRVISLKPQEVSGFSQLARGVGSLILIAIVGVLGFGSYILYSSAGAQGIANLLEKNSFVVRGVSGSLAKGIRIESLSKHSEHYKLELKNLFFQVNQNKNVFDKIWELKTDPVINKIQISSGQVEIFKDISPEKEGLSLIPKDLLFNKKKEKSQPDPSTIVETKSLKKQTGKIDSVEIANLVFKTPDHGLKVERFSVGHVVMGKHSFEVGHIYLKGSMGTFLIKDFTQLEKSKRSSYSYDFTLKPNSFFPKRLRKPFRFLGNFSQMKESLTFDLKSSDNRLSLSKNKTHFNLKVNRFPLDQYFKGNLPIKSISLVTSGKSIFGKVKIRNQVFHFSKQPLFNVNGGPIVGHSKKQRKVGISWVNLLLGKPWLLIENPKTHPKKRRSLASPPPESNFQGVSRNSLSELYVNKPYNSLSPKAKSFIHNDINFFSNSFLPTKER